MTLMHAPITASAPIEPASAAVDPERRFSVGGVRWATYVGLCDDIVRGNTRITYDQGRMEIVVVSNRHELTKKVLARIIEAYADAAGITAEGFGNVTIRAEDLERGLEPDECYYVANAAVMTGLPMDPNDNRPLDLSIYPPPDLAIEVDISPPDVSKQPIYGAMGVPEIWRFDGRDVTYLTRGPGGQYAVAERSQAFPDLPVSWVNELLQMGLMRGQSAAAAEVRRRVGGRPQP